VLGALASGILLFGMSLLYGFTGSTSFAGIRAALTGEMATGRAVRRDLRAGRSCLQDQRRAVPHVDARRLRRRADAGHDVLRHRAQGRRCGLTDARVTLEVFGSQAAAWQQIVMFAALASIVVGALGAIGQRTSSGCWPILDQQRRLHPDRPCHRQSGGASGHAGLSGDLCGDDGGQLRCAADAADEDGEPVETFADIAGLSAPRPALAWCLLMFMFSLAGHPAAVRLLGQVRGVPGAVEADLIALAAIGIAASVIGAFYYLKFVKVMFFDEPGSVRWLTWPPPLCCSRVDRDCPTDRIDQCRSAGPPDGRREDRRRPLAAGGNPDRRPWTQRP
jgi:NADH-quinone oxidoreductase subunit N